MWILYGMKAIIILYEAKVAEKAALEPGNPVLVELAIRL